LPWVYDSIFVADFVYVSFTLGEMNFRRNGLAGAGEPLGGQPDGRVDLGDKG